MTLQDTELAPDAADRGADPAGPEPGARPGDLGGLRPLLMRVHFYAGVFVGPFVLVAALTGLLYTLSPQIEQAVHSRELTVPVGAERLPLAEQVAIAQAALPAGTLTEVRPAPAPEATTRVTFDTPDVREDYQRTVFVDPYTGEVRGTLDTFGEWLPARAWLDELHRTLLLGDVGRVYSELAASWLWVLAGTGLVIWTVRKRRDRRLRRTLLPQVRGGRGRGRLRSWHGAVGIWALAGMLLLSATGLTWSQFAGANVSALRSALDWSTPSVSSTLPVPAGAAGTGTGVDEATTTQHMLDVARGTGMGGPVEIRPPEEAGGAWAVQQVQRSWPTRQDAVAIDPASGAVVEQIRFADWPLAAKLARWGIDTHMGLLFGVVNQVLLAALALGIICMVVWASRMWWLRRPTSGGTAGPPGAATRP
ncbi:MAG TPA: PepSY-associated TM helix domain-containing protein, partial [Pseudonocardiaceae bacterium]|nr:PepSY-associated TM helix domain-containing protein [Pseudonocardiaceae bacterium]